MNTRQAYLGTWLTVAIMAVLYVSYAFSHPRKHNAPARRITAMNAAPRWVTIALSNSPPPSAAK